MWEKIQKLLDRVESRLALWTWIAASGSVGILTGVLSRGVNWINQFGWFGWWSAGLIGFLTFAWAIAGVAWAVHKWALARATSKWKQAVDTINPLESEFHKKRIRITDLISPATNMIDGKRFAQCEILGPANLLINGGRLTDSGFSNCNFIPVKDDKTIIYATMLRNCVIVDCIIVDCNLFFRADTAKELLGTGQGIIFTSALPQ